ncbi:ABC transporter ATP-binding protein [bacterium]|nr:ABC transporter ATP-binding protein [bacterium]
MNALSIDNVKKIYGAGSAGTDGGVAALKGVSLTVPQGQFFGLLGPNGAGKSTLIHSIVGLAKLSSGSISVFGHDVSRSPLSAHQTIGFAPQDMNLDRFFSIRKTLMYQAGFYGIPRAQRASLADQYLEEFGLTEKADVPYYRLSGGMQKRLLIAKAVITQPKLLILDEPTAGVDVEQRHHLWDYLRKLNKAGTTIILTTHYIDEAEELCDTIGVIHLGEIREMGKPKELIDKYCEKKVTVRTNTEPHQELFKECDFKVHVEGRDIVAYGPHAGKMTDALYRIIHQAPNIQIDDLHVDRGTLEDVFLKITGRKLDK